jgi:hypothetical protein
MNMYNIETLMKNTLTSCCVLAIAACSFYDVENILSAYNLSGLSKLFLLW